MLQALGVVVVGAGVVLVRGLRRAADRRGIALALCVAACIAGYTIIDKQGLAYAAPISYNMLVLAVTAVVFISGAALRGGIGPIRAEVRLRALVAGIAAFAAYTLVLAALERAPAAAVAAVRESSVLIATILAAVFLHERVSKARLIVVGVALVALS